MALSETLHHDLRAVGSSIGVSVLCPGVVPTRIGELNWICPRAWLKGQSSTPSRSASHRRRRVPSSRWPSCRRHPHRPVLDPHPPRVPRVGDQEGRRHHRRHHGHLPAHLLRRPVSADDGRPTDCQPGDRATLACDGPPLPRLRHGRRRLTLEARTVLEQYVGELAQRFPTGFDGRQALTKPSRPSTSRPGGSSSPNGRATSSGAERCLALSAARPRSSACGSTRSGGASASGGGSSSTSKARLVEPVGHARLDTDEALTEVIVMYGRPATS